MEYAAVGCRSLLALLFLASAGGKLRGPAAYAAFVAATRRMAPRWAPGRALAAAVLGAEAATAVLLAVPATVTAGFCLALALLAAFTVAVVAAVRRDERAPCACFGSARQQLGYGHAARNALLAACAGLGLATAGNGVPGDPAGVLTAVAVGAVAAAVTAAAEELTDLFRPTA
ncbi:MauE/DoxX family redox-associated membrane protein [Streptomyces sp. NPDC049040]|uniref:MauE/DoxX family redox-associated membrane protein n=1 Tax=Streptomyces sp. NPDC049040 TaxID=3365593 RepID=UPI003713F928